MAGDMNRISLTKLPGNMQPAGTTQYYLSPGCIGYGGSGRYAYTILI
mgnify:CR=1 FL=1